MAEPAAAADLAAALKGLTPRQRDLLLRRLEKEGGARPEMERIPRQGRRADGGAELPASFAQERLWFLDRLEPGSPLYNIPAALEIAGPLDARALAWALGEIARRHEALRTTFAPGPGGPVQVIHPAGDPAAAVAMPRVDLAALPKPLRTAEAGRLATDEARRPFDLARGPLLRALLIRLEEELHLAVLTVHHIVSDGGSMGVIVREIAALVPSRARPEAGALAPGLPEPPVQYADFAVWQRERLRPGGEVLPRELAFWRAALAGAPAALDLPTDRPRPSVQTFRGAQAPFRLGAGGLAALRAAGQGAGVTLFMQILAAWELLLQRWTGQDALLVGSPVAGRARPEVQGTIGLFVNTLVLRGDLAGEPTVGELLARVRETALAAFAHQELPFGRLIEELHPRRDLARPPLFQTLLILQRAEAEALELPGLRLAPRDLDTGTAKLELTLQLAEGSDGVAGWIEFNTDLFEPATAERLAAGLGVLLAALPQGLDRPAAGLPVLAAAERRQLLEAWNATGRDWPAGTLLHELFERQAARTPEAPAVGCGGEEPADRLTYRQLDERSNRLARALRRRGVGPEVRVGLCVERSAAMVVALLGVLKAGGAYVPLDPGHPAERLALILEDSAVALLLTEEPLLAGLPGLSGRGVDILCLDRDGAAIAAEDAGALEPAADAASLAYVIYTSGSTGRPKGVQLPHRAVVNFLRAMAERPGMAAGDAMPALTTLTFDIAGLEIYLPLAVGGRIEVLSSAEAADGRRLAARLEQAGVTAVQATPATWRLLIATGWRGSPGLKVLCGGEALPRDLAGELLARVSPGGEVWNLYGPTETAVWSAAGRVEAGEGAVPLGEPVANTVLHVVDSRFRLAPLGAAGELLIGGAGLARGYLGRPELTAERFVPDPWSPEPGARLYRTGDLVRRRSSGELEFLGRIDHQVKVRGFRIELGEIEAALLRHPAVAEAVVAARREGEESRLVAYVVAIPGGESAAAAGALRDHLRRSLPEYMLPAAFVLLDALPLNPSGKVDRRALPAPGGTREAASGAAWADPRDGLERSLAGIWREVLKVDRVGLDDNFFDLGGHSLLAAQVHARLAGVLGREVALLDLFRYPTVRSLAGFLGGEGAAPGPGMAGRERGAARRQAAGTAAKAAGIAIVGMAGRFPGAGGVEAFWSNLVGGVESISFFGDEELRAAGVPEAALADPRYVRARGVVAGAEEMDAPFFGYSPREAEMVDPQQRLFLECAWEAFEDAGHDPATFPGDVGVFAGAGMNTYALNVLADPEIRDTVGSFQLMISNDKDFLAPRVSYKLGLKGPSFAVQSACSTSLVAVHLACQSLLSGECDAALAGGVSLVLPQSQGYHFHDGAVFSPDGHCRAFDAAAGGFVGGNGAAVVLLRRLEDALAGGDPIHAVIRGSAVNNDGAFKAGFTAPSVDGQAQVIAQALAVAGLEPAVIGYVEAHGTGTELGDPIEIAALAQAFGPQANGSVAVGSLKTNIGHLDSAAGVAGLIKAALVVERGQIPPSLHFATANPKLELAATPFRINDRLTGWPAGSQPRRAGVSSLGIGGTNAHAIVEQPPALEPSSPGRPWQLLPLSARGDAALSRAVERLAGHLGNHPDLPAAGFADIAWTLQAGRRRFDRRAVAVCRDSAEALGVLGGSDPERLLTGEGDAASVVFLFSGQGSQHPGMAAELYAAEPAFRAEVDRACGLLLPRLGRDLRPLLFAAPGDPEAAAALARTEITQPALFVIEHALARLWISWGVRPRAMIGHSVGEYVAACLAGVFSLEDALAVVAERGRLMGEMPPGAMLAVSLPEAEIVPRLTAGGGGLGLAIAAVNAPARTVVAGPAAAIDALAASLEAEGVQHRRLRTSHAFHSAMMEPAVAPFLTAVRKARLRPPSIPFLSNVTGTWITPEEATDPEYWGRHLRGAVRFADGVGELLREPGGVYLEVGPGNALATLVAARVREREGAPQAPIAIASLPHPSDRRSDLAFALTALGRLWLAGIAVDWAGVHAGERRLRVPGLPTYPFERKRYWIGGTGSLESRASQASAGSRAGLAKRPDPAGWLYAPTWTRAVAPAPRPAGDAAEGTCLLIGAPPTLAERLRAGGRDVALAEAGDDFAPLLAELRAQGRAPRSIVHCDGLGEVPGSAFHSLARLARALGELGEAAGPVDLCAVGAGLCDVTGGEELRPERATLLGATRVIPWELPHVACRTVDVELPLLPPDMEVLAREIEGMGSGTVALRGGRRWVPGWEPFRLDGAPVRRIREDGVYLVTGGLGGVGSEIAKALARGRRVRLALVGRTPLPPRAEWPAGEGPVAVKIQRLLDLEALGAEVLYLPVDVADRAALADAFAEVRRRFGALHGVVHAAGVAGGGLLQRRTDAESERVLAARVHGALHLLDLLAELPEPADFLVLTSSLGAQFGEPGQADLCAAGAFFDALAAARSPAGRARRPGPFVLAIDWDTWREVGMAADLGGLPEELRRAREQALATGIAPAEGGELFLRLIERSELPQVVVSTKDLGAVEAHLAALARGGGAEARAGHARPELRGAYVAPRDAGEEAVAAIWQGLLGIERVGVHDNFFDLGGHSLLATQVTARVRETLKVDVPLEALFEAPTVAGLAARAASLAAAAAHVADDGLEALLAEIEGLSADEALSLYAEESNERGVE
jgi:amino acid adenylation domain-containing protein